jgi:hypothetical protein
MQRRLRLGGPPLREARKAGAQNHAPEVPAPEKRIGRDDKLQSATKKPKLRIVQTPDVQTEKYWQDQTNALSRKLGSLH